MRDVDRKDVFDPREGSWVRTASPLARSGTRYLFYLHVQTALSGEGGQFAWEHV